MADFSVVAKLMADSSAFTKGVGEAKSAIETLPKSTSQAMSQIGSAMQSVGTGMTKFITAPVVAGVTAAIKSYADLEQAIGGIETLFKGSASTVISNSESAYKRAGVSGVDYMEQVTSFSATLLQGLGGDTVKAAEYADKAIVDMSDKQNIVRVKRIEPNQGCAYINKTLVCADGENLRAVA